MLAGFRRHSSLIVAGSTHRLEPQSTVGSLEGHSSLRNQLRRDPGPQGSGSVNGRAVARGGPSLRSLPASGPLCLPGHLSYWPSSLNYVGYTNHVQRLGCPRPPVWGPPYGVPGPEPPDLPGCPGAFKRSRWWPQRLVLGQEMLVTGIFISGRTGTEARASDMAECGKGDCVQRSSLWPEARGKEG